jgi:hypothetical protein
MCRCSTHCHRRPSLHQEAVQLNQTPLHYLWIHQSCAASEWSRVKTSLHNCNCQQLKGGFCHVSTDCLSTTCTLPRVSSNTQAYSCHEKPPHTLAFLTRLGWCTPGKPSLCTQVMQADLSKHIQCGDLRPDKPLQHKELHAFQLRASAPAQPTSSKATQRCRTSAERMRGMRSTAIKCPS